MKHSAVRVFFLLALAGSHFIVGADQLPPGFVAPGDMLVRSNRCWMFGSQLEEAVKKCDFMAIQGLYRTNGVSPEELKLELARWTQLLDRHPGETVSTYFKELDLLPSLARESWTRTARQLTDREVTHLVSLFFPPSNRAELVLPLVLDQDRLQIVASEKRNAAAGVEPDTPTESAPMKTNLQQRVLESER